LLAAVIEKEGIVRGEFDEPGLSLLFPSPYDRLTEWIRASRDEQTSDETYVNEMVSFHRWVERHRPNENKISDGYRERAPIEVEAF
jgi:hypothetical protein